jgi:hypothetical protein
MKRVTRILRILMVAVLGSILWSSTPLFTSPAFADNCSSITSGSLTDNGDNWLLQWDALPDTTDIDFLIIFATSGVDFQNWYDNVDGYTWSPFLAPTSTSYTFSKSRLTTFANIHNLQSMTFDVRKDNNIVNCYPLTLLGVVNLLAAPAFTLSTSSETATTGTAMTGYTISSTGGSIASYSISPTIGNGLSFSTSTGRISGTPSAAAAAVTYTITGTNATSFSTATYQITVNAAAPVEVPDPIQQSKIAALSISSAVAGTPSPIVISGSFIERISAISINGTSLAAGSWSQTATSVSFTMPAKSAGIYEIQLYNGAVPVLKSQSFTFTAPVVVIAPTPMPIPTVKVQSSIIKCVKDSRVRRIRGINPTCPDGYVKK